MDINELLDQCQRLYFSILSVGIIHDAPGKVATSERLLKALALAPHGRFREVDQARRDLYYVIDECRQSEGYITHAALDLPDDTDCKDAA